MRDGVDRKRDAILHATFASACHMGFDRALFNAERGPDSLLNVQRPDSRISFSQVVKVTRPAGKFDLAMGHLSMNVESTRAEPPPNPD